ncbi:MAG: trypsin-like peptidase domain-containing protein [Candidatus Obscuribacter sp.]|nr:trypsin-like peptidase domain-containing protein [Candidatus Obscuribacter sp.]
MAALDKSTSDGDKPQHIPTWDINLAQPLSDKDSADGRLSTAGKTLKSELTEQSFSLYYSFWGLMGCSTRRQAPELANKPIANDCGLDLKSLYPQVQNSAVQIVSPKGNGSGFYACQRGQCFYVTNQHVAGDKGDFVSSIVKPSAKYDFDQDIQGYVAASDRKNDIAIIYAGKEDANAKETRDLTAVKFATDSDDLTSGMPVFSVGHPLGIVQQVVGPGTLDTHSGKELRSSIVASPGDSGSPWFNSRGEAIGILTTGLNSSASGDKSTGAGEFTVSFATRIEHVRALINKFIDDNARVLNSAEEVKAVGKTR